MLKGHRGPSQVVQWIRIRLQIQATWVGSLVGEDCTCHGRLHMSWKNYCACAPKPLKPACSKACDPQLLGSCAATTEAHAPRTCVLQLEKPPWWEAHVPQLESSPHLLQVEKALAQQQRPSATKNLKKRTQEPTSRGSQRQFEDQRNNDCNGLKHINI